MQKYFRTEEGKLVEIIEYSTYQAIRSPDVKIYIGTDSQVKGPIIHYVITIAYQIGRNGVHCIYKSIKKDRPPKGVPMEHQINMRLQEEMYLTMEVVQYFIDNSSIKIEAVEFDYNDVEDTLSKKLVSMSTGWAKGLGLKTRTKPDEMYATKFSNHKCQ